MTTIVSLQKKKREREGAVVVDGDLTCASTNNGAPKRGRLEMETTAGTHESV